MGDYPFTPAEVLSLMGYSVQANRASVYLQCPWCMSKNKPLNVNLSNGMYRCNKNDEHKGNVLSFYAKINNMDNKAAYKEICERLRVYDTSIQRAPVVISTENICKIDFEKTNKVLQQFPRVFKLSKKHEQDLLNRGFSKEAIIKHQYCTLPEMDHLESSKITPKLGFSDLAGVSGFYMNQKNTCWMCYSEASGIMVPYRDFFGKLTGEQIRKDEEKRRIINGEKEPKYVWFTSVGKNHGTKNRQLINYNGTFSKKSNGEYSFDVPESLVLIEGAMKGDLFYDLTSQPNIDIPGVNCLAILRKELPRLKERGLKTLLGGFDMDRMMNDNVMKALYEIAKYTRSLGIEFRNIQWDATYRTMSGDERILNSNTMFIFTPETLYKIFDKEMTFDKKHPGSNKYETHDLLKQTLRKCKECNHKRIMFALKDKSENTIENHKLFEVLEKECQNMKCFIEVTPIYWQLKHKGIDDLYAWKLKGIES